MLDVNFYINMSAQTNDNNNNNIASAVTLMSDETKDVIEMLVVRVLQPITLVFGICANLINLYVFMKTGLNEGANITFFSLTFSDLCFLLIHFCSNVGNFLILLTRLYGAHVEYVFNGFEFSFVMTWYASIPYNISVLTTAFIAVQRCLCVALPFQFKGMFTRTKTALILAVIYVFIISTFIPILNTFGFRATHNSSFNVTMVSLYFVNDKAIIEMVYYLMTRVMFNACEIIIFVCAIILSVNLFKASKFRKRAIAVNSTKFPGVKDAPFKGLDNLELTCRSSDTQDFVQPESDIQHKNSNPKASFHKGIPLPMKSKESKRVGTGKLSGREMLVVKSVMLVSFLFLLSNLPENILYYVSTYVPEFGLGKVHQNIFLITYMIRSEVEFFNSSIYIFVYCTFNSKFRTVLRTLLAVWWSRLG